MVADLPSPFSGPRGDYIVRAPQAGDVLAGSLRAAYRRDKALPSDMARLLSKLGGGGH
ncbi:MULTISPECIES: hypothetical protein [unclassified Sphingomonas]|uniref:hypothetical protein n=1 Tax=unclassified Sphingomonas TaxID=196159 RepID=UPI00161A3270|nr:MULTISPECIES: hypothetical protein [unclassified Sphingomonas]MBB3349177.1 hypothetical protein [Sphingomonas sp. BK069]MBB3474377.1 hypothetical protein [Sphingomonas sp. BK345]